MKKRIVKTKVRGKTSRSKSILMSMLDSFLHKGKVETIVEKAMIFRSYVEKEINYARTLKSEVQADSLLRKYGKKSLPGLMIKMCEFLDKSGVKPGGLTRIIRTGIRAGDGSVKAEVVLLGREAFLKLNAPKKVKKKKTVAKTVKSKDAKKTESKSEPKSTSKKPSQQAQPQVQNKENFFSKMAGRLLGRRFQATSAPAGQKTRSNARSGI